MNIELSAGDPSVEKSHIQEIYSSSSPDYIGDAIEITKFNGLSLPVILNQPYSKESDYFEGKFILSEQQERFHHWMQHYTHEVKDFIANNIEDQSSEHSSENAKVGLVSCRHDAAVTDSPALVIQPVNHLVTVAFNRKLGLDRVRLGASSQAHKIWKACFSHAVNSSLQEMTFINPSQLFVEFGLITADDYIPITEKATRTSVYAMRNKGEPLKTCGLETGLNWVDVIREGNKEDTVTLDVKSGLLAGLKRRFPMPDWDEKQSQIEAQTTTLVLQTLHLNTAIIGTCKIPYTKDQLNSELKGKICGGLDHINLSFIHVSECQNYIDRYANSTAWHGSAMVRLKAIVDHKS
jgi:hypothetical protein